MNILGDLLNMKANHDFRGKKLVKHRETLHDVSGVVDNLFRSVICGYQLQQKEIYPYQFRKKEGINKSW